MRIAAHFTEVRQCGEIVHELKKLGYEVGLNLMQAGGKSLEEITACVEALSCREKIPDVIYFADSFGNMNAEEVKRIVAAISRAWQGAIGFHAHNNRGLAVSNALAALTAGASWIDATVAGMGRGAGNAETELLLAELGSETSGNPEAIYELATNEFAEMKARFGWGPNFFYYYASLHNVHPTYVQEMLSDDRYGHVHRVEIVRALGRQSSSRFDRDIFEQAVSYTGDAHYDPLGEWSATDHFKNSSVVLMAAGPMGQRHLGEVLTFCKRNHAPLITINYLDFVPVACLSGVVTVDPIRAKLSAASFEKLEVPVYSPLSQMRGQYGDLINTPQLYNYGMACRPDEVAINNSGCVIPAPLSAIYAMALVYAGGASHLYLAGFDGYETGDPRRDSMVDSLKAINSVINLDEWATALTPTSLAIKQGSVYARN